MSFLSAQHLADANFFRALDSLGGRQVHKVDTAREQNHQPQADQGTQQQQRHSEEGAAVARFGMHVAERLHVVGTSLG